MFKILLTNLADVSFLDKIKDYTQENWPFLTAQFIVRAFYIFLLYSSIILFQVWDTSIQSKSEISFILPIAWIRLVDFGAGLAFVRVFFITSTLLATLAPQIKLFRVLAFIAVLEFVSLYFSVLQIDVDWYTMITTAFLFIFLPDKWENPLKFDKIEKAKFLLVFWSAQAIILLTYTMSGIGKVIAGISQFIKGESNVFEPHAAALQTADRLIVTNSKSILGSLVIDNALLLWPLYLGMICLLLFSFSVAFKPRLHRIWGFGLLMFHIVNYLTINIGFNAHVYLISLLFILSPFAPIKMNIDQTLEDVPIIGAVFMYIKTKRI